MPDEPDLTTVTDDEFERLIEQALADPAARSPFRDPDVAPRAFAMLASLRKPVRKKLEKKNMDPALRAALTDRSEKLLQWRDELKAVIEGTGGDQDAGTWLKAAKVLGRARYAELKPIMRDIEQRTTDLGETHDDRQFGQLVEQALADPAARLPFRDPGVAPKAVTMLAALQDEVQEQLAAKEMNPEARAALTGRSQRIRLWREELKVITDVAGTGKANPVRLAAEKALARTRPAELEEIMKDIGQRMDLEEAFSAHLLRIRN